jgi:hypothetical protein
MRKFLQTFKKILILYKLSENRGRNTVWLALSDQKYMVAKHLKNITEEAKQSD